MWPSRPVHVAYMDPYLLCFCDRGIDVFNVTNAEWTQILQFPRTKPLDKTGALCLNHESQDSIRLIHLRPAEAEEIISLLTKNRSLIKSKLRKGSLSRTDETYQSLVNSSKNYEHHPAHLHGAGGGVGSTSLSYSNSTVSQNNTSQQSSSSSRKSLISNPINFQHLQHMGPNDGRSFMTTDIPQANNGNALGLPPISGVRGINTSLNNSGLDAPPPQPGQKPKTNTASSGNRQIAKKEISGPTNFRHVVRGLDEYGLNNSTISTKQDNGKAQSLSSSRITATPSNGPPNVPPPPLPTQNHISIKSSSLSSSSSSSSSILNSPHSPTSSNNENLSQAISNTLKANSVLYNESFLNRNQTSSTSTSAASSAKQNAVATNGSNEVKNHSVGAYENVGYFKIEEESLDTMTQAQTSGQTAAAANSSYLRQNIVNTSSESGSLNSSKRQSNGEIENA